ncbi:MAG: hypothetical protein GX665_12450 [Gammaproteobacteria bacterium]|nr:hypothetical protein [Gammaproteobacteria bacterium]
MEPLKKFLKFFVGLPVLLTIVIGFAAVVSQRDDSTVHSATQINPPAQPLTKPAYVFQPFEKYTPEDLGDIDAAFRQDVADMMNRMAAEIPECNRAIFMPLRAGGDSANPEFSVRCGNVATQERVKLYYFTWLDVVNRQAPHVKRGIDIVVARRLCRDKAYASAKHPAQAELTDIAFQDNQDGTAIVVGTLKAPNSFGVMMLNDVRCEFTGAQLSKFTLQ